MNFAVLPPSPEVADLVRYFWVLESVPGSFIPPRYLALADSCPELIFQYGGGFQEFGTHHAHIIAPRITTRWRNLDQRGVGMFGVRFYPDMLHRLTRIPVHELNNTAFRLDVLFGSKALSLIDEVNHAHSTYERIGAVTFFLRGLIRNDKLDPVHHLYRYIMSYDGQPSVNHLVQVSGFSERQLQRKFKKSIGFSASYFKRLTRFQTARRKYMSGKFQSFTALAHECQYSDQSHFIREFREFSGMSPKAYFGLIHKTETEASITKNLIVAKDVPPSFE